MAVAETAEAETQDEDTDTTDATETVATKPRVYMAGPIRNVPVEDAHGKREDLQADFPDIDWQNPLDNVDLSTGNITVVRKHGSDGDVAGETITSEQVIEDDKELLESSDAVLAWFPPEVRSVGTSMEVIHAYEHDIPVVVWYDAAYNGTTRAPPIWLDGHADALSSHRETAVERLRELVND